MDPVVVLQNHQIDGPGFLEEHLAARGVPMKLLRLHAGDPVPATPKGCAGIAVLGGPQSVNDGLPELAQVEHLLARALEADVPVLGHCLGGQLLARALGARVTAAPVLEIGWSEVIAAPGALARHWFGAERMTLFQWHYESFELPPGAEAVAHGAHCANQAFALGRRHLAMQFHCELTAAKLEAWLDPPGLDEIDRGRASPAVQSARQIRASSPALFGASQRVAAHIYDRWIENLRR